MFLPFLGIFIPVPSCSVSYYPPAGTVPVVIACDRSTLPENTTFPASDLYTIVFND